MKELWHRLFGHVRDYFPGHQPRGLPSTFLCDECASKTNGTD